MSKSERYIVGLDIGTTKIACVVAELKESGSVDVVGVGESPSRGLRKGVVVNLEATVDAVKSAVEQAELMAGVHVESATVGIAGGHIRSFNSRGVVAVCGKDRTVSQDDLRRVLDAARAVSIPDDREIVHVLAQEFVLDDQGGIARGDVGLGGFVVVEDARLGGGDGVGVHYLSIPEHPYYQKTFGWNPGDYPNAMNIGRQTASLPLSAKLTDKDVEDVIEAVNGVLASHLMKT